uniref:CARD- and ANK-containing Inflammasome Adaptor Protein n=1 Tax=Stegastes partitus TaxID=144197 RepID=A0A3B5ANX9_9TELE
MLVEPDLYQRIKTYVGSVNEQIRDSRRQLIGYLLERDHEWMDKSKNLNVTQKIPALRGIKETKRSNVEKAGRSTVLSGKKDKPAHGKSENLLHMIAANGEPQLLEELLEDTDINAVNSSNKTLLHVAAEQELLSTIQLLICKGARLDLQDDVGHTALHTAASRGHTEIIRVLMKAGAPIHTLDSQGKTPIHLAAENEHLDSIKILVKEEAKQSESHTQDTFLHKAVMEDNCKLAELLLQNGAAVDAINNHKKTALFYAVKRNNDKMVKMLLNAGAKVDRDAINEAINLHEVTILQLLLGESLQIVLKYEAEAFQLILMLFTANAREVLSQEALGSALLSTLLEQGLDPNITGAKGQTPVHLAAQCNRPDLMGLLLEAGAQVTLTAFPQHLITIPLTKANPNATDNEKKTALHLAALAGKVGMVTSLLSHKAKGGVRDMDGSTPLHYAAAGGHAGVVSALLQSLNNKGIQDRNAWRKTPLHTAAEKGHDNVVVQLLEAGAKINTTDQSKDTPLHCAARGGHQEVVKRLVNWGQAGQKRQGNQMNLQATNNVGKTALQLAESEDTPEHENTAALLKRKMFLIK